MGTPKVQQPQQTEEDNGELDRLLLLVRSMWTNRRNPSPHSQWYPSGSSPRRTGLNATIETPETTCLTTGVVGTSVSSRIIGENDPLVDPTETGITDLVTETIEAKEAKDIDPLRGNHHEGRIEMNDVQRPQPDVGNTPTTTVLLSARISRGTTFVEVNIFLTSAQNVSNESHLPQTCRHLSRARTISQTGFRAVLGQTRGRLAKRRPWGSRFFRSDQHAHPRG